MFKIRNFEEDWHFKKFDTMVPIVKEMDNISLKILIRKIPNISSWQLSHSSEEDCDNKIKGSDKYYFRYDL